MSPAVLRVWFLCTLLLAGLMPLPAAVAGHGGRHGGDCCARAMHIGEATTPSVDSVDSAEASDGSSVACCCGPDASADADASPDDAPDDAPADEPCPSGDEDCACGDSCRCPRCGSTPGGVTPAVRPRGVAMPVFAPERAAAVPTRTCVAREASGGLLRPPQA